MKKSIILFFFFLFYFSSINIFAAELQISSKVFDTESMRLIEHSGPGAFDNYLAMNLPYNPVKNLFDQLQKILPRKLINRSEAHITVITPVEYWNKLRPIGVSIEEINQLAKNRNLQKLSFEIVCLGRGEAIVSGSSEQTYYIVLNSEALLNFRKEVQKLVITKGGDKLDFDPDHFYPHITLGFTKRDLHEEDGIIKNSITCLYPITIKP